MQACVDWCASRTACAAKFPYPHKLQRYPPARNLVSVWVFLFLVAIVDVERRVQPPHVFPHTTVASFPRAALSWGAYRQRWGPPAPVAALYFCAFLRDDQSACLCFRHQAYRHLAHGRLAADSYLYVPGNRSENFRSAAVSSTRFAMLIYLIPTYWRLILKRRGQQFWVILNTYI